MAAGCIPLKEVTDTDAQDLPAGDFAAWLEAARQAGRTAEVPCGECNACCRSGYFVTIGADETRTLARIPRALLFAAPGGPPGSRVLARDDAGQCPLLVDGACSIYAERPLACREFDCRVFAAAGIAAGEGGRAEVTARAARWRFDYASAADRLHHAAVRAAAALLEEPRDRVDDHAAANPTRVALRALVAADVVLRFHGAYVETGRVPPAAEVADAVRQAGEPPVPGVP